MIWLADLAFISPCTGLHTCKLFSPLTEARHIARDLQHNSSLVLTTTSISSLSHLSCRLTSKVNTESGCGAFRGRAGITGGRSKPKLLTSHWSHGYMCGLTSAVSHSQHMHMGVQCADHMLLISGRSTHMHGLTDSGWVLPSNIGSGKFSHPDVPPHLKNKSQAIAWEKLVTSSSGLATLLWRDLGIGGANSSRSLPRNNEC